MKHTKGNWYAHDGQIYPEETGKTLALTPYFDKENKEQEANAKLIAAAPDMLAALQNIADRDLIKDAEDHIPDHYQEVQDAISKAIH